MSNMVKLQFHDGREFEVTKAQADFLRDTKNSEKSTNLFTLTHWKTGKVICEEELKIIKGFKHSDPRAEEKISEESNMRMEIASRTENKRKREAWTNEFLKDDDGSIIEQYEEEATKRLSGSIRKGYIGKKFINTFARMLIREVNKCPYS